jgi:hypothetical protein
MMAKFFATSFAALFTTFAGVTIVACLDVPLIHVDEPEAGPPIADASTDGSRPCESCLRASSNPGPGCAQQFDACFNEPTCRATMECAIALGCPELQEPGKVIDCGNPCAVEAGLNPTTGAINILIDLLGCATTICGPICRGEATP